MGFYYFLRVESFRDVNSASLEAFNNINGVVESFSGNKKLKKFWTCEAKNKLLTKYVVTKNRLNNGKVQLIKTVKPSSISFQTNSSSVGQNYVNYVSFWNLKSFFIGILTLA